MPNADSQRVPLTSDPDGRASAAVTKTATTTRPQSGSSVTVSMDEDREKKADAQSQSNDAELIAAARNGDSRAFGRLVQRYEKKVARTVIAMLGNTTEADDVGQETFIRFYRSLESFREESALGTYLTRIAINLSLNELKRRTRRGLFFGSGVDTDEAESRFVPTDSIDLSSQLANRDLIQWALAKLSPNLRAVVTLRLIEGYSTAETARTLNIPQGTALSRLSRAQKQLQTILSPHL